MKHLISLILCLVCFNAFAATDYDSIVGYWRTIDDKTNKPRSIVQIYEKDGLYYGKIIKSLDDKGPKICQKCPGEFKDKPTIGLQFIWDFKAGHYSYTGGKLLDPETGDIYSGSMKLKDDGKLLQLRGYVGIPMFGRSQTWERIEGPVTPDKPKASTTAVKTGSSASNSSAAAPAPAATTDTTPASAAIPTAPSATPPAVKATP